MLLRRYHEQVEEVVKKPEKVAVKPTESLTDTSTPKKTTRKKSE